MNFATLLAAALGLAVTPSVVDAVVRLALAVAASRRLADTSRRNAVPRCLVVIPARAEGSALEGTLQAVRAAVRPGDEAVVLLDGEDAIAAEIAARHGISVVVKSPPGPTKAAALAWLVTKHLSLLQPFGAVMILDTGSVPEPGLMEKLDWPTGVDAVQTLLVGEGSGVGEAAAFSERSAQHWEDRGREALGWNVHLRGTGTVLSIAAFAEITPALKTCVEDWEMTLLLGARGRKTLLGPDAASVRDTKPQDVQTAAAQRARWLVGQVSLPFAHPGAFARLVARKPVEGAAFAAEVLSRPYSLSILLRVVAGIALVRWSSGRIGHLYAGVIFGTLAIELTLLGAKGFRGLRSWPLLVAAWVRALLLIPSTFRGWHKGRRP